MTIDELHDKLDEILSDKTEGVMLIGIAPGAMTVRVCGHKTIIQAAWPDLSAGMTKIIDDYPSDGPEHRLWSEVYAD
jgi:hypothetical protein